MRPRVQASFAPGPSCLVSYNSLKFYALCVDMYMCVCVHVCEGVGGSKVTTLQVMSTLIFEEESLTGMEIPK